MGRVGGSAGRPPEASSAFGKRVGDVAPMRRRSDAPMHQFADLEQQREASQLGMWIFLATEVMFFGGLFTAYAVFRHLYPEAFRLAAHHSNFWLGSANTAVLLISSLFMALAVDAAKRGANRHVQWFLMITVILGTAFLGVKGVEYAQHIHEGLVPGSQIRFDPRYAGPASLFYFLYFSMTGLHAVHMLIGIGVLLVLAFLTRRGSYSATYYNPIEVAGLYWHFVDVVWIFLYPMFYLIGGHG